MGIEITRRDVVWSYAAKIFQIASGLITLPLVLHLLTPEEVGMNYLMLTVSSIVALLDFGFSPQFSRNFTYVSSGSKTLLKEGVSEDTSGQVDWHLMAVLIHTAKRVYSRLSLLALVVMLTAGTAYIGYLTEGFASVRNALPVWILYSLSTFFNIYYSYYISLLTGSGMIRRSNQAVILSKSVYLLSCTGLLLAGCGLFAVAIANFMAPLVQRYFCYRVYFSPERKLFLSGEVGREEIRETFRAVWYNARKLGINFIGSYAVTKMGIFIIGFFLPLASVGSYGLLQQLAGILSGIANTLFVTYLPKISNLRVSGDTPGLKKTVSFTIVFAQLVMLSGSLSIVFLAPWLLTLIHSQTVLPSYGVCGLYMAVMTLELNHSQFASVISTGNKIPFVIPSLVSGSVIVLLTFIVLKFTGLALMGVVLVQGLVQAAYNNWRWPMWVFRELGFTLTSFYSTGLRTIYKTIISLCK